MTMKHKCKKKNQYQLWSYNKWIIVCTKCYPVIQGQSFYNYKNIRPDA